MRCRIAALLVFATFAIAGCSRPAGIFSEQNARAHVGMLAGTIGSRAAGTPANARARAYIVEQLRQSGFEVRVQETDARRHELGLTARVSNIIAVLPGSRTDAIGIVSHYDSVPDAPGAADDGLGVAVSLETARLIAASQDRTWTTFVLITDGEELGLMGAAALVTDREVTDRLRAYLNIEAIGSAGTAVMFETGPANHWLAKPWARHAPHPRGGSYGIEVYRRLPNDTDFSILKTREIPGLNFAAVDDSYPYHTARDTAERLSPATLRTTGENVMAIVNALQRVDITQRSTSDSVYFDIGETVGLSWGSSVGWIVNAAALFLGVIAWVRVCGETIRAGGIGRLIGMALWTVVAAAAAVGAMVGATWLLRNAREVYHPWYASPGRLFVLLAAVGTTAGWAVARIGQWLPARTHRSRHPALVWTLMLPIWIVLAAAAIWYAPQASYLWTVPLLSAGLLLSVTPPAHDAAVRLASFVVLAVAATLWLRETIDLMRFIVAIMGRLPIVTPSFVYAAIIVVAAIVVVPPAVAALASPSPLRRPVFVTALLLLATALSATMAYLAPAYTHDRPLRRHVRAVQEADAPTATWEIGSVEPGLDLDPGAPGGWTPQNTAPAASVPIGRYTFPFVFRTAGPSLGAAPLSIAGVTTQPVADGVELMVTAVPREPGLTLSFVLPEGIRPARTNLPGLVRRGRWTAHFAAAPPDGVVWRASFRGLDPQRLHETRIAVTSNGFPGGEGWQRLPGWLPQERAVWQASATWIVAATAAPIAPVPPLR
jgi:Zn-dependent M28 family amino/carboxypeptidase